MLVRVSDPDRLVDLIILLKNSGFPLAQRQTAKLHDRDEAKVREAVRLWEATYGVRVKPLVQSRRLALSCPVRQKIGYVGLRGRPQPCPGVLLVALLSTCRFEPRPAPCWCKAAGRAKR